jgi:transposase-like protein
MWPWGVNMDGERDVLGCWVGPTGGEGAKFWMSVLTELRNRGIQDTFIVCCDGLKGLPDSIRATWPLADVQLCVVHLVRSSLRYTSKKHWGQVCAGPDPVLPRRASRSPQSPGRDAGSSG